MIKKIPEEAFARATSKTWKEFVSRGQITEYDSALLFPVKLLRSPAWIDTSFMQSVHIRNYTLDDNVGSAKASRTKVYVEGLKNDIKKNGLVRAVGIQSDEEGKQIRIFDGTHRIWIFHQLFEETGDEKWAWIRVHFNLIDMGLKTNYSPERGFYQDQPRALKLLRYFERMFMFKLDTDYLLESE